MKILHICISGQYIDGWGYQENLLPDYLNDLGVENSVIAPIDNFPCYVKPAEIAAIRAKGSDYFFDGVRVIRIKTIKITTSLLFTRGLKRLLEDIKPDAIFHHNFNCSSLVVAARYSKRHSIPLLVDNHADEINMTTNKIWSFVYYRFIIRMICRNYKKELYRTYGVTKSRCDFIEKYYGIPKDSITFLPIGADTKLADTIDSKLSIRSIFGFGSDDMIVVSGGKMGKDKGTDKLIIAINSIVPQFPFLKLVLFGKFEDIQTEELARQSPFVRIEGWCDRKKTLSLLKMADVACWPIHHTTLVEDAISVKTSLVLRKTDTTAHLIEGNGVWLDSSDSAGIASAISTIFANQHFKDDAARLAMVNKLDYKTISRKVLSDIYGFGK